MRRILCTVEYDGTDYAGWQRQLNGLAVQQVLEEALARATGKPVAITGASRTDAGVHARGQAFHFDTESSIPPEKYPFVLNTMLPRDIRVHTGQEVPAEFHARFMTAGKRYTYRICNSRHGTALGRNLSAHVPLPLEESLMQSAAQTLLGTHDFMTFCGNRRMKKSTVRTVDAITVTRDGPEVRLRFHGDGFLYHMVRILTGTLLEVGQGLRDPRSMPDLLACRDRARAGFLAPAQGLWLESVEY